MRSQNAEKSYVHQRETIGSSSDSLLQLRPFSKLEPLLKKKEFAPRGSEFFPLSAVPYGMEDHFYHINLGDHP